MNERQSFVRVSLSVNALFSLSAGLAALFASGPLALELGLPASVLPTMGGGLIVFAALLVLVATRARVDSRVVALISLGDFGFVALCLAFAVFAPGLTGAGLGLVLGLALATELVATAQLEGGRRALVNPSGDPRLTFSREQVVDAAPADAWAAISDVGSYSEVAPSIDFSRTVSGEGLGAIRECGDASGRWTESCVLWEEGRRFRFHVKTDAADYPYPFRALHAEWYVEPEGGESSRIGMRVWVTMPGGWLGDLMVAVLVLPRFEPAITGMLDGWAARVDDSSVYASSLEKGEPRWEPMSAR